MKPTLKTKVELAGMYRMVVTRPDGTQRDSGWFPNLITTSGLNRIGTGGIGNLAMVGSGSTPPVFANTALEAMVAYTNNVTYQLAGAAVAAPYYGFYRRTFRFEAGQAAGNLSEVGLGWDAGSSDIKAFSRALIRDANGDPTTITVLGDEVLDVTYEMRLYSPAGDTAFNVDVSGTTHACVMRAAAATSSAWTPWNLFDSGANMPFNMSIYQGPIGSILEYPSGSGGGTAYGNPAAYVNNSLKREYVAQFGLDNGNVPGGVGAFYLSPYSQGNLGMWQVSVDPKIAKDNTKILTMVFELSWARKV